jgi:predicted GIY-YIG superfamily endonuclease
MLYFQKNTLISFPKHNNSHTSSARELHRWPCHPSSLRSVAISTIGRSDVILITRSGCRDGVNEVNADGQKIMFYVYIIQSINFPDKFYIGFTDDLKRRLKQHNNEHSGHTNKYRPWRIKDYFAIDDEQKAKDFEKYLKSQCGREFIKKHF